VTYPALRTALAGASNLTSANATVTVCLAARGGNGASPSLHRLQLTDGLAASFVETASKVLSDLHTKVAAGDYTLEAYDAAQPQDHHEVEVYAPPAGSSQEAVVNALSTLAQLPIFDGASKVINNLSFHVLAIQRPGQPDIYLFRKYSKTKELGRSKKLVTLFSGGTFDRINEPVFIFDEMIDAIWIGGHMAILHKDSYHRIFQFFQEVLQHAQATLANIQAAVAIDNVIQFQADCVSNSIILIKLRGIAQRNYLPSLTIDALEAKILAHNLPIQVVGIAPNKRLVYDPQYKWKFLRLLDDAFLHSDLTGMDYEAAAKRVV